MEIVFVRDGLTGRVSISCVPNDDPAAYGTPEIARGFPVCTATVQYPARGYSAMFGWVQLIRYSDNASAGAAFESDPFELFADSAAPYCWYGTTPTLFDAPWPTRRRRVDWVAHSFLGVTPLDSVPARKVVLPLLGFSWGYSLDDQGGIILHPVERLSAADWDGHVECLTTRYPEWSYGAGLAGA
jgi:hypothetical protein